jgi:hypothetical protein
MLGAQPAMVRCTTAPTGAASGQTVIDPPAGRPDTVPAGSDAQPAAAEAVAAGVATEAAAEGAAEDGPAAGLLDWVVAAWVVAAGDDAAELDVTGAFAAHAASTAVRAQAAPTVATGRKTESDFMLAIWRPPARRKLSAFAR